MAYPLSNELEVEGDPSEPGKVTLSNGTNAVTLQASGSMAASYDFTLPPTLGAVGESLMMVSPTTIGWDTPSSAASEIWIISDIRPTGTNGGTSVAVWNDRVLNTITSSPTAGTDVQLAVSPASTNEILIQAGSYYVYAETLAYNVSAFKSALWNVTTGTYAILGQSSRTNTTNMSSAILGAVTFASQTVLSIRTYVTVSVANNGLGRSTGLTFDETYIKVYIQKL